MSLMIYIYILIFVSYLIGSIPFGVIISRAKGIDIRSTGSGNIGATNVLRGVGKSAALLTLVCDILKGAAPLFLLYLILGERDSSSFVLWGGMTGLAVVLGHLFPVFLSFKGGKGVATGLGVMLFYSPSTLVAMIIIWLMTAAFSRYSSLSAITAYTAMPIILALSGAPYVKVCFGLLLAVLIVLKHASNIQRLLNGTETKIGGSK